MLFSILKHFLITPDLTSDYTPLLFTFAGFVEMLTVKGDIKSSVGKITSGLYLKFKRHLREVRKHFNILEKYCRKRANELIDFHFFWDCFVKTSQAV